jgi:hypothetical protein
MITTFAPTDAVGSATASVTLPPVRVAAAVAFVTAAGAAAVGATLAPPPPLAAGAGALGDSATTGALGVTAVDAEDAALVPTAFVAATVNVYAVPFASPLIVQLVAGVAGATDVTEQVSPVFAVAV